jgi:hypothetical protein
MDSIYHKKYLKYRQKYLALKNQIGGTRCPQCGNELKNCTCDSRLPQSPAVALTPRRFSNLTELIDAFNDKNNASYIKSNLETILTTLVRNDPTNARLIRLFIRISGSNRNIITYDNLVKIRNIFAKLDMSMDDYHVYADAVADLVFRASRDQHLLDLLSYLFNIYDIPRDISDLRFQMNYMNPIKADYLLRTLINVEKMIHEMRHEKYSVKYVTLRMSSFNEEQYRQLFIFTSNGLIDMLDGPDYISFNLTDDKLKSVIEHFKDMSISANHTAIEDFIRRIRS